MCRLPNWLNYWVFSQEMRGDTLRWMGKDSMHTIRDLYPDLSEKELAEAEDNLDRYLAIVLRIFERKESGPGLQEGKLTPNDGTLGSDSPKTGAP